MESETPKPKRVEDVPIYQAAQAKASALAARRNDLLSAIDATNAAAPQAESELITAIIAGDPLPSPTAGSLGELQQELGWTEQAIGQFQTMMLTITEQAQQTIRQAHATEHEQYINGITAALPPLILALRKLEYLHRDLGDAATGDPFFPLPRWMTVQSLPILIKQLQAWPLNPVLDKGRANLSGRPDDLVEQTDPR